MGHHLTKKITYIIKILDTDKMEEHIAPKFSKNQHIELFNPKKNLFSCGCMRRLDSH